ncbi:lipid A deacylase LpxR family protein [Cellvibrio sp. PSBB023]|uniref:lipid A deacylase LpxR family protein n=1 Tax=Cellvibrio sp. PSBB023 TaxID=1945512 RepID=UPI00098F14AA|nr:lipid A deacylase LpxR family protein [Cellvibrio sp. PSBB023]
MDTSYFIASPVKASTSQRRLLLLESYSIQLFIFTVLISISSLSLADPQRYLKESQPEWLQLASTQEPTSLPELKLDNAKSKSRAPSWAFAFDNDVLVPGHRDQDYTYGINFTQSGITPDNSSLPFSTALTVIDSWLGNDHQPTAGAIETFSREWGAFGFTPEDITISAANPEDRPYASLLYLSNSREKIDLVNNIAWKSTLTVGMLGLGLVGELQNIAHKNTAGTRAEGWDNQISEGGEITARYAIARQQYFDHFSDNVEIKSTIQASVGYLTEASWGLSMRAGRIHSPWSSFNPELASYGEKSSYSSSAKAINEHYFWSGFAIKARAYNAFLQGQFRDSAVTYQQHELRPLLIEAWAGYTFAFKQGYRISYVLRGHSSEIKHGAGDRNLLWGGIIIARSI